MFEMTGTFGKLRYVEMKDELPGAEEADARYVVCETSYGDFDRRDELLKRGYVFLDRILRIQIDTQSDLVVQQCEKIKAGNAPVELVPGIEFSDEMASLYHKAYTEDRRFHLTDRFDQEEANAVIDAYLESFKADGAVPFGAVSGGRLVGCTMLQPTPEGGTANNLGATAPGIKGRMTALPLYLGMMDYIRESGVRMYYGEVSTCNMASLNLHFSLGGKVTAIKDKYILRRG